MSRASGTAGPAQAPGGLSPPWRVPLLILGFVGLVVGSGAGLARLGWAMPDAAVSVAGLHGPLMICGFFGVVISLERAVAIGRLWAYLGALLAGLGTAAALHDATAATPWLYLAASAVLFAASLDIMRRQRALFTATMALGAACWGIGNALWAAGWPVHQVAAWWLAFLILTIAGERLELSRLMPPSSAARAVFTGLLVLIVAGLLGGRHTQGAIAFGVGLLGLAAWLFKQDIARRTVRQSGLTRFIAVCLLSGYAWLAVGGALIVAASGPEPGTPAYDAALHALGLGFVFSMVLGHAPIIFPAVLRVAVPYRAYFYGPLVLLHASLLVRLCGDAFGAADALRASGALHAVALAAFIAGTAFSAWRGRRTAT